MPKTETVAEYMARLEHPMKAEMDVVREIIQNATDQLAERIKWNAPSFYLKANPKLDLLAFHPRATDCIHLVLVFHNGAMIEDRQGLLEGDYKDRRMVRLHSMADIEARRPVLENVVRQWVALHT